MVKIYEKYDKLEKPIVKLSDAIKSLLSLSNKDQENIMKGVSYVLGDELDTIEAFISTVKMTRISKDDEYDDVEENVEDEEEDSDQWSDTDEEDIEDDEDELEPPTVGDIVIMTLKQIEVSLNQLT
jgi:TATA-binding protein-associated factor Taf7